MASKEPKSVAKSVDATKPVAKAVEGAASASVATKPVAVKPATAKGSRPRATAKPAAPIIADDAPVATSVQVETPVAVEPSAPAPVEAVAISAPATQIPVTPVSVTSAPVTPSAVAAPAASAPIPTTSTKKALLMENALHTVTEKTQALFADMNDRTKAAVEKSTQMLADMNEFGKGNVEAIVESSKIAAKGMETIGQDAAEFTRKTFEGATAAMRNMASVKTPADFMKLQSELVRTAFDSLVAETSKNTEAMLKLAGDVAQPLSNRVAVAVEKVKTAA